MFIVFEGIDGSGKQEQTRLLKQKIGANARVLQYPDETGPFGSLLRSFLKGFTRLPAQAQMMAFAADIVKDAQDIEKARGKTYLIADRYLASTAAYQSAQGIPLENILGILERLEYAEPDVTVYIDLKPKEAVRRKIAQYKETGRLEAFDQDAAFLAKVRKNYLALAKKKAFCKKWVVIDGSKPLPEVHKKIMQALSQEEMKHNKKQKKR